MPHATTDSPANGEKPSSEFIKHLTSYPVVHDGIETYKANPYGKTSLDLVNETYSRLGKPVEPYLETPYSYAKPYVQKADELANEGLNHVDAHFPIIKEDTNTIVDTAKDYAFWPYNYLTGTFQEEWNKTSQGVRHPGLFTLGKATISTELRIVSDFFHAVADFIGPKVEQGKKQGKDLVSDFTDKAEEYTQYGKDKVNEFTKKGQETLDEAQNQAHDTKEQAKGQAKDTKEQVKGQAKDTKEQVKGQAQGAKEEAQKKLDK